MKLSTGGNATFAEENWKISHFRVIAVMVN